MSASNDSFAPYFLNKIASSPQVRELENLLQQVCSSDHQKSAKDKSPQEILRKYKRIVELLIPHMIITDEVLALAPEKFKCVVYDVKDSTDNQKEIKIKALNQPFCTIQVAGGNESFHIKTINDKHWRPPDVAQSNTDTKKTTFGFSSVKQVLAGRPPDYVGKWPPYRDDPAFKEYMTAQGIGSHARTLRKRQERAQREQENKFPNK